MGAICIWLGRTSSPRRAFRGTCVGEIVAESETTVVAENCFSVADFGPIGPTVVAES